MAPILEIDDLSVAYRSAGGDVHAVEHVTLTLNAGEVVGLCGESGSGKSTLAYGATRLLRPPALITGGTALSQVWLFIVAPLVGAVVAAVIDRLVNGERKRGTADVPRQLAREATGVTPSPAAPRQETR